MKDLMLDELLVQPMYYVQVEVRAMLLVELHEIWQLSDMLELLLLVGHQEVDRLVKLHEVEVEDYSLVKEIEMVELELVEQLVLRPMILK
jgi:hypothetical protein